MLIMPGRVVAATVEEAIALIEKQLRDRGFEPVEAVRPYACRVQTSDDETWFEYYVPVRSG